MTSAPAFPARFADAEQLEDFMTTPSPALVEELAQVPGDLMVMGIGGKMGPTLARLAKRAAPARRVVGVARFSEPGLRERLESWGIECLPCDLLDGAALARLPELPNLVFMAGHKFGASDNPALTWASNTGLPFAVADRFRQSRTIAFSTACVYPFVPVDGPGAPESLAMDPPGEYALTCVGREHMFGYGSRRHGTPGRLMRLSYAIDMRYGVLHDVASLVLRGEPVDVTMGTVDVIWQGDANEQTLRLLNHCTTPTSPINVSGARHTSVRWLAEQFGVRFGKKPQITGREAGTAWLVDTSEAQRLFGPPRVSIEQLVDWTAHWLLDGGSSFHKATHFEARDGKY